MHDHFESCQWSPTEGEGPLSLEKSQHDHSLCSLQIENNL